MLRCVMLFDVRGTVFCYVRLWCVNLCASCRAMLIHLYTFCVVFWCFDIVALLYFLIDFVLVSCPVLFCYSTVFCHIMMFLLFVLYYDMLHVYAVFASHSRIFHSPRHSWQLSSEGSLACHIYYDTGHPFIVVISGDP